jgi:hypothetical protein
LQKEKRLQEEMKRLNRLPVSQKAKEMLEKAGERPDPMSPYIAQLARWGIEKGKIEVEDIVAETVKAMLTWRPARIKNFLMLGKNEGGFSSEGFEKANKPVELAQLILNDIEDKLMIHFPWYHSLLES